MIPNTMPDLTVKFWINPNLPEETYPLEVGQRGLTPSDAKIHPFILTVIESIGQDCAAELGNQFRSLISCRMRFSLSEGLTLPHVNKEIYKNIILENMKDLAFATSTENYLNNQMFHLKLTNVSQGMKEDAYRQFKTKDLVFLNIYSHMLFSQGIFEPVELNVNFVPIVQVSKGGLTTGHLRFLQIYKDILERYKDIRQSDQTNVCMIGPGLVEEKNQIPYSPQYVEMLALFPNANFCLFDNNKAALSKMQQSYHTLKMTIYDPLMLKLRLSKGSPYSLSENSYETLNSLSKGLIHKAVQPNQATTLLKADSKADLISIRIDPKKMNLREFDIVKSDLKEEDKGKFDVIIATKSIILALVDEKSNNKSEIKNLFSVLGKFLPALRENGSIYLDDQVKDFYQFIYGTGGWDIGIRYLESQLGYELLVNELPLTDIYPDKHEKENYIEDLSLAQGQAILEEDKRMMTSTNNVHVITKTSKKLELSPENRKKIQIDMLQMITKANSIPK